MAEILEILVAMLAVWGAYSLLDLVRERLLYPKRVRVKLRCAVMAQEDGLCEAAEYFKYLRREQKISPERLIILVNDDIMKGDSHLLELGDVYQYIICKEPENDGENTDLG